MLSRVDFPYPMFLTTWHMLVATCLTRYLASTTNMLPAVQEERVDRKSLIYQVLPVAAFYAVSLVLSNTAYLYLSVAYIQMIKAFTPVTILFVSMAAGLESPTLTEFGIIALICLGVAVTSVGELHFSAIGFIIQICGIMSESFRLVLTNVLLRDLKLDPLSMLYYVAPMSFVAIGSLFIFTEASHVPWERVMMPSFIALLIMNGAVAFALNIAVNLLIGKTSALILTLAGIFKVNLNLC